MIQKVLQLATISREKRSADISVISLLVKDQNWRSLRYMLNSRRPEVVDFLKTASCTETILHLCCRFYPPIDILRAVYECNPSAVAERNETGRFPIHVACIGGASLKVIEFLIKKTSNLVATAQDVTGKTPLHLACEYYVYKYNPLWKKTRDVSAENAVIDVVKMLCAQYPDMVNIEDNEGRVAIETAIEFECSIKVIKAIQKASEKDWRIRRGRQLCHSDVKKEFQFEINSKRRILEQEFIANYSQETNGTSMSQSSTDIDGTQANQSWTRNPPRKEECIAQGIRLPVHVPRSSPATS